MSESNERVTCARLMKAFLYFSYSFSPRTPTHMTFIANFVLLIAQSVPRGQGRGLQLALQKRGREFAKYSHYKHFEPISKMSRFFRDFLWFLTIFLRFHMFMRTINNIIEDIPFQMNLDQELSKDQTDLEMPFHILRV